METNMKWDNEIWNVIDSYFKNTDNYLSKNQLDSFNTFIDINIPKTIRQFNPIVLPYAKKSDDSYLFELSITVGGSINENGEVLNDGSGIYIGKPIIQEVKKDDTGDTYIHQKTLYPNEARLKNLTYKTEIDVDIIVEIKANDGLEQPPLIKKFERVPLGNIPIMLQSKICSLFGSKGETLRLMGECQYDQGGYFIIDGKEKVIVSQTRQVENKIYVMKKKDVADRYKYESEIRSAPENKFQPARITRVQMLNRRKSTKELIEEDTIRVTIPNITGEIPLFIVMRALGVVTDREIVDLVTDNIDSSLGRKMLEILRPSIIEGSVINNQLLALEYLENKISNKFMTPGIAKKTRSAYLADILKNFLLPHVGSNYLEKAYFLGYMVNQTILTNLGIKKPTDKDSYIYKRIDLSGFLISAIFRDLYFRVKNRMIEVLNVGYSTKDSNNTGEYWNNFYDMNGVRQYEFYKFLGLDETTGYITIDKALERKIVDEGFLYAFKNCWGLKDAPCKEGVVQDLARLTYIGYLSHIRRVNTPLSASAKIREPHSLHGSQWGIMCPPETPDGANIGVRNNFAIMALVSSGTNSNLLHKLLTNNGVQNILQVDVDKQDSTKIFLNERFVGYTNNPMYLHRKLKLLKRNALINIYTSICWLIDENIIKISTDSGRAMRPLLVVKDNQLALTPELLDELKKPGSKLNWKHLIGGLRNKDMETPFLDNDPNYYHIDELENNLDELEKMAGVIEYVDKEEENSVLIALTPNDLQNKDYRYNYCEIHPDLILGVVANSVPLMKMNQAPRNQFSAGQSKQALGTYASNYRNRMDTKGQIMFYPQRSIIKNKLEKYVYTDDLPNGINAIVALGCFSGYNQDDSIVFNKSSIERGLFRTTKFRTYSAREEIENNRQKEKIMNPDPSTTREMKPGNYRKLDENGIIKEESKVNENDIIIGKVVLTGEKDENGNEILIDNSEYVRKAEDGFIDRVYSNVGNDNQRYVKIRIRKDKVPELGDKFCSRHGQKGTVGMLIPKENLPVSKLGVVPDIIVNAHAFPSRMTIAQFLELIMGKACTNLGMMAEMATFSKIEIEDVADMLEKYCGFERYGNEVMYSGITGEMMKVNYFIGPTFYQRLTHQVSDKYQSRDDGSKTTLTHQPVGGRALGGGGRLGEMERDAILSHGVTSFLKESFMERSDKYQFYISTKTGLLSVYNKDKNIYRDFVSDETIQYVDDDKNVIKRPIDSSHGDFVSIEAPYAFKLFIQELEAMGVAPRLISERVQQKWKSLYNLPEVLLDTKINDQAMIDSTQYNKENNIYYPMHRFISKIKENLLFGSNTDSKNQSLVDFSMGNGDDIYKWYRTKYNTILGIDKNYQNIEGTGEITGAKAILKEMRENKDDKVRIWSNNASVTFIAGEINRDIHNFEITKRQDAKYGAAFKTLLGQVKYNYFDTGVVFNNFSTLFDTFDNANTFFENARSMIRRDGYLIITTIDGPSIFSKLRNSTDKGTIKGTLYDENTDTDRELWKISITSSVDIDTEKLPSDIDNGFNHKIQLTIDNKTIDEYLVHPTLILTLAYRNGFRLVTSKDMHRQFRYFNQSAGLFDELFKKYTKINTNDNSVNLLESSHYSQLLEFINMHRYFVFTHDDTNIIPNHVYELDQVEKCKSDKMTIDEPKYSEYNLPINVAMDTTILNNRILEMRAMWGNVLNTRTIKTNLIETGSYVDINVSNLINDINSKFSSETYREMGHENFKNSMSYIFKYIKLGIYVRIVNNTLAIFTPMFNFDYNINELMNRDIDKWNDTIKLKISGNNYVESVVEFLNNKYSLIDNDEKRQLENNSDNNSTEHVWLDGCRIYFRNNMIHKFIPDFISYRHMLEELLINKTNGINDCEFIINVLQHPIYKVNNDHLVNPFANLINMEENIVNVGNRLIPVLGISENAEFLDISMPSAYQWNLVNKKLLPPDCTNNNKLFNQLPYSEKYEEDLAVNFSYAGCGMTAEKNQRLEFLNKLKDIISYLKGKEGENKFTLSYSVQDADTPNIVDNNIVQFYPNIVFEYKRDLVYDSRMNLYIDGFGTDDYLTQNIMLEGLLLRLNSDSKNKLWYEKLLTPYDFSKSLSENKYADHVIIENLTDDLYDKLVYFKKNTKVTELLVKNLKSKSSVILSKPFIFDYMQFILNKINKNMDSNFVNTDVFEDIIKEELTRETIQLNSEFIGVLLGKSNKNIQRLMNTTDTIISVDETLIKEEQFSYVNVTITGGKSSVNKAKEVIGKIANSIHKIVKVPNKLAGRVLGRKFANKDNIEKSLNVKIYTRVKDEEIVKNLEELELTKNTIRQFVYFKIVGEKENVEKAVDNINRIIENKPLRVDREKITEGFLAKDTSDSDYIVNPENKYSGDYMSMYNTDFTLDPSMTYQPSSPIYTISPDYKRASSPVYTISPGYNPSSSPQYTVSPRYNPESPVYQLGGELEYIDYKLNDKIAIIIPLYQKDFNITSSKFNDKFNNYLYKFNEKIFNYKQLNGITTEHEIIVVDYNYKILDKATFDRLELPEEIILDKVENNNVTYYYIKLNKGTLFNIGYTIATDKQADWIIFHEPFLLPNNNLISKYFENPMYNVHNLSNIYEPYLRKDRLGIFSITPELYKRLNGYPNHIWSYDACDRIFIDRVKSISHIIDIVNRGNEYILDDMAEKYHMYDNDIYNENISIELSNDIHMKYSGLEQLTWFETALVKDIDESITYYKCNINYNCYPISYLSTQIIEKLNKSIDNWQKLSGNELWSITLKHTMEYLENYISKIYINCKDVEGRIVIDDIEGLDIIDVRNIINRLNTQLVILAEDLHNLPYMINNEFANLLNSHSFAVKYNGKMIEITVELFEKIDRDSKLLDDIKIKRLTTYTFRNNPIYNFNLELLIDFKKEVEKLIDDKRTAVEKEQLENAEMLANGIAKMNNVEIVYNFINYMCIFNIDKDSVEYIDIENKSVTTDIDYVLIDNDMLMTLLYKYMNSDQKELLERESVAEEETSEHISEEISMKGGENVVEKEDSLLEEIEEEKDINEKMEEVKKINIRENTIYSKYNEIDEEQSDDTSKTTEEVIRDEIDKEEDDDIDEKDSIMEAEKMNDEMDRVSITTEDMINKELEGGDVDKEDDGGVVISEIIPDIFADDEEGDDEEENIDRDDGSDELEIISKYN